jgi:MFS family permease
VRTPRRRSPFRDVLANQPFAAIWLGQTISNLGDVLFSFALLWHVLDRTGSALLAGYVAVAATAGRLIGSLAAAAMLDRSPARRVLLLSDGGRFLLAVTTGLWWASGVTPPLVILYGLAFAIALGGAFLDPARAVALPQIVAGEQLVAANALDKVAASLTETLVFALAGVLAATLGPSRSLLLDAATFLASFLAVRAARWDDAVADEGPGNHPLSEIAAGLRWVRASPIARTVLAAQLLHALAAGCFFACIAPFLRQHLDGGAGVYGIQGAVFGIGLIVGAWLVGHATTRRIGVLYALGIVVNGLGNSGFALSSSLTTLLPAVFVAGLGGAAFTTSEIPLLLAYLPTALRGRVIALTILLATSVVMPSIAFGGWLGDHVDTRSVMLATSLLHVGIGLALGAVRRVREVRVADMDIVS